MKKNRVRGTLIGATTSGMMIDGKLTANVMNLISFSSALRHVTPGVGGYFRPAVIRMHVDGAFGALQKKPKGSRRRRRRTHRGMTVRYVNTLANASSGMSLKAEHSGRVMMTLESSPRPPGQGKENPACKNK